MKSRFFLIFIIFFCAYCLIAQPSTEEENIINQVNHFRMELEKYDNPQIILEKISEYENTIFSKTNYKDFSEETKLILENMFF